MKDPAYTEIVIKSLTNCIYGCWSFVGLLSNPNTPCPRASSNRLVKDLSLFIYIFPYSSSSDSKYFLNYHSPFYWIIFKTLYICWIICFSLPPTSLLDMEGKGQLLSLLTHIHLFNIQFFPGVGRFGSQEEIFGADLTKLSFQCILPLVRISRPTPPSPTLSQNFLAISRANGVQNITMPLLL